MAEATTSPLRLARMQSQRFWIERAFQDARSSIGYRRDKGDWQLYTGPFSLEEGVRIQARAVRYGWKASDVVTLN